MNETIRRSSGFVSGFAAAYPFTSPQLGCSADRTGGMGKVMEKIKLTNSYDEDRVQTGDLEPAHVRSLEIEALVDTGATILILPADVVQRLGLREQGRRKVVYANGREDQIPWIGGGR